jgi:type I site-specific restriction endonuclease
MSPEEKARQKVDSMLTASGWAVQTKDQINLSWETPLAFCYESTGFFEQMKGRGVRVVSEIQMEQVNPGIKRKTQFFVVDAVGVCERVKTESRPLEKKPAVSFDKLLDAAALGTTEVAAIESLAGWPAI